MDGYSGGVECCLPGGLGVEEVDVFLPALFSRAVEEEDCVVVVGSAVPDEVLLFFLEAIVVAVADSLLAYVG